jgi:hypothetical protein
MKFKEAKEFIISDKELKEAFPELYEKYKNTYGSKRPTISVYVEDVYNHNVTPTDWQSDYWNPVIYYFLNDNRVAYYDASKDGGKGNMPFGKYKLEDGDAVLACYIGAYKYVGLYVNSNALNRQSLPVHEDLDLAEQYVLVGMRGLKPFARKDSFINFLRGSYAHTSFFNKIKKEVFEDAKLYGKTYDEAYQNILLSLEDKGLIKINKAGSSQLTNEGKNVALSIKNNR